MERRKTTVLGSILSIGAFAALEILIPDRVANIALIVMATLLLVGLLLVIYGTIARNRWGVNFEQVHCPRCQAPVPKQRKPRQRREVLWGGATCDTCGCEMDKWGQVNNYSMKWVKGGST